jgi:hypothetical protein
MYLSRIIRTPSSVVLWICLRSRPENKIGRRSVSLSRTDWKIKLQEFVSWMSWLYSIHAPLLCTISSVQGVRGDHRGRAVWVMNCLSSLELWGRGFESHSRHECLCVPLFFMFLVCTYVAALRRADRSSKESYRLCIGLKNWKSCQSPTKGL